MTLLLQGADTSAQAATSAAPSATPAASAVVAPETGQDPGLAGGMLPAPSWLVVLLAVIAVSLGVAYFVLRRWLKGRRQKDDSVAPMSSRR